MTLICTRQGCLHRFKEVNVCKIMSAEYAYKHGIEPDEQCPNFSPVTALPPFHVYQPGDRVRIILGQFRYQNVYGEVVNIRLAWNGVELTTENGEPICYMVRRFDDGSVLDYFYDEIEPMERAG